MFKTLKLSKEYWQKRIPFLKIGVPSPLLVLSGDADLISRAMTSFRFGQVFKTTKAHRHHQTQLFLQEHIKQDTQPVILDIGASDGSTSENFIDLLDQSFKIYFVTDYNIECQYIVHGNYTYFFDHLNSCFLIASEKFVFYPDDRGFLNFLFKKKIKHLQQQDKTKLLLCSPALMKKATNDARIKIMRYNIFEAWAEQKPDIIIVGNLLNRSYFSENEIIKGLQNCYTALYDKGILAIIRNELSGIDEIEKCTVFEKDEISNGFKKKWEINQGVEITGLVLSQKFN